MGAQIFNFSLHSPRSKLCIFGKKNFDKKKIFQRDEI